MPVIINGTSDIVSPTIDLGAPLPIIEGGTWAMPQGYAEVEPLPPALS